MDTADGARAMTRGLVNRRVAAAEVERHERTLIRWERLAKDPLPVIRLGKLRLYDIETVQAWIMRRQYVLPPALPRLGRPATRRGA